MKIETIQNTYIEAEIVLTDRRLKTGETVQLRCVLDSKLGPVYLTEKLTVDEYKSTSNDTYCRWNYVLQEKCILPGTYNFEIVVVQSSGLVIPVSSKAENCLIIVPAERGECFLNHDQPAIPKPGEKYPTLTIEQKMQIQKLIEDYFNVRRTLFYYTGAVRRENYVYPEVITNQGYSSETKPGCVLKIQKDELDKLDKIIYTDRKFSVPSKSGRSYYKYMLNCGLYCQMIWMGRPISDFIEKGEGKSLTGTDANDLLWYVENGKEAPSHHTLQAPPASIKKTINSVFVTEKGEKPWGYYFNFESSKRAYGATGSIVDEDGNTNKTYYTYNTFYNYQSNPVEIEMDLGTEHAVAKIAGSTIIAYPLTNQVIVSCRFRITPTENIPAGTSIVLGTLKTHMPALKISLSAHHASKVLSGMIYDGADKNYPGNITVRCNEELVAGTHYISVSAVYAIESAGENTFIGFDGAANMAEELYAMGCEVPYSEMDVGDLVFFRAADISNDLRNKSTSDDDDAMSNKLFRYISHVGIVYGFDDEGYPIISDCTNAYSSPIVIGQTSMADDSLFRRLKACAERNNTVMVARHPAAFGLGGNVPDEFEPYRGILV